MAKYKNTVRLPRKLPKWLRPCFWDVLFCRVNGETHADFVAYRLLESGDWDGIRWLRRMAGDAPLIELVRKSRGVGLSRRQLRFWQLIWGLPKREVDEWLLRDGDDTWDRRAS